MADQIPTATVGTPPETTTPTATRKSRPATQKATSAPRPAPSGRTTRSQTKALGLDDVNANLKTLEVRGLYAFDTRGDGNCLYYALSDQMYGDWDHASEIRDNLSAHMEANREYFSGFAVATGGERRSKRAVQRRIVRTPMASPSPTPSEIEDAFQGMLTRTATNYIWGGAEEIQACCQYYKKDIRVYSEANVQDFRAWNAPADELRGILHLAYISNVHYSSVRNVDGPHEGLPKVSPKEVTSPVVLDLASPWKISCIQEGLGGQYDHDAIVEMLRRCRGDIDRAFANLLDEESSSTASFVSSATSAASSQTSTNTSSILRGQNVSHPLTPDSCIIPATFKPRLISSRSSSRHSTASKRSADDSDNEGGGVSIRKQRGREQKRRILPKVTVGINFGDQEKPDLVSLRLRVNPEAVAEQASPEPTEHLEQPKEDEGRKLRPRKPRRSVPSESDTSSVSNETPIKEEEEE